MPQQVFFILRVDYDAGKLYLFRGDISNYNLFSLHGKIDIPNDIPEILNTLNITTRDGEPIFIDPLEKRLYGILSTESYDVHMLPKPMSIDTDMVFIRNYMCDRYNKKHRK